jgi:hypothetical protein
MASHLDDDDAPPSAGQRIKAIARWIAVLPASIISGYLAWLIVRVGNEWTMARFTDDEGSSMNLFAESAANGGMGAFFVYAGARVAPSRRKETAFVLCGIALILAGAMLYPAIRTRHYLAAWDVVCLTIGAGTMVYQIARGETRV